MKETDAEWWETSGLSSVTAPEILPSKSFQAEAQGGGIWDALSWGDGLRIFGGGHGNPLQYSCLENPHGQRSLVGYSPWGCRESDTEQVSSVETFWLSSCGIQCIKPRNTVEYPTFHTKGPHNNKKKERKKTYSHKCQWCQSWETQRVPCSLKT